MFNTEIINQLVEDSRDYIINNFRCIYYPYILTLFNVLYDANAIVGGIVCSSLNLNPDEYKSKPFTDFMRIDVYSNEPLQLTIRLLNELAATSASESPLQFSKRYINNINVDFLSAETIRPYQQFVININNYVYINVYEFISFKFTRRLKRPIFDACSGEVSIADTITPVWIAPKYISLLWVYGTLCNPDLADLLWPTAIKMHSTNLASITVPPAQPVVNPKTHSLVNTLVKHLDRSKWAVICGINDESYRLKICIGYTADDLVGLLKASIPGIKYISHLINVPVSYELRTIKYTFLTGAGEELFDAFNHIAHEVVPIRHPQPDTPYDTMSYRYLLRIIYIEQWIVYCLIAMDLIASSSTIIKKLEHYSARVTPLVEVDDPHPSAWKGVSVPLSRWVKEQRKDKSNKFGYKKLFPKKYDQ